MEAVAHKLVLERLKDPASAIFNYDLPRPSGLFCGTVKARNSFGGYGDDVYYILFSFGLITSEDQNYSRVRRLWELYCVDRDGVAPDYSTVANN